jgi:hypothetical protein
MSIEDSKKAIKAAIDFYKFIVPKKIEDIHLEGIEMVSDDDTEGKNYKITLSCSDKNESIFMDTAKRRYNVFIINKYFEFVSMGAYLPDETASD